MQFSLDLSVCEWPNFYSLFIRIDEVLAELQFAFVCFLVGQHYDSFEHWKKLLVMFCTCEEAILENPQLYMKLISEMYFQVRIFFQRGGFQKSEYGLFCKLSWLFVKYVLWKQTHFLEKSWKENTGTKFLPISYLL